MDAEQNAKRYFVSGTVQGVGYRYFVERAARHLKLAGYVRNLLDGRVEAYAIGDTEALATLRARARTRPAGIDRVSGVIEACAEVDALIRKTHFQSTTTTETP